MQFPPILEKKAFIIQQVPIFINLFMYHNIRMIQDKCKHSNAQPYKVLRE